MTKEEREEIESLKRMVKDGSVTVKELKEKVSKLEETSAAQGAVIEDLESRLGAVESKVM